MKINPRQNAIVARRMARNRWSGADTPGKARKTNVVPRSEKAITKWDEDGLAFMLSLKYPKFDLKAELAAWDEDDEF